MSKHFKLCHKTSFPNGNLFCHLIDKIIKRLSLQLLGQWGYHCYEPRIYRTLAKILRKGNPDFVQLLLKKTKNYLQDRSCHLALIWRTFTPVYCPSPLSSITPLLYVAQTSQSSILKILLQYGILEREKDPLNIVLIILLYPSRVRIMVHHERIDIEEDDKTCLVLCSRVLSAISIKETKMQLSLGRRPIISNWLEYIPPMRYKDPCELSHLCRITIRTQLLTNNMLPDGIFSSQIPVRLQKYLNLES
ncbi:ankyrin repeat and SOCS box protein 17 isoform X2 [Heterocephalus glaber]|uniref:Ankyrin repeat and SOCS box protein 17 isoform X2 n=1 Tax=Heterocephalus glaber TaxID=10181 RepID=A0AAX6SQU8_HETGA|nr:ankyrin repeat and SOCS box protein 17 isoform X2 [Heterocephalus glaber]